MALTRARCSAINGEWANDFVVAPPRPTFGAQVRREESQVALQQVPQTQHYGHLGGQAMLCQEGLSCACRKFNSIPGSNQLNASSIFPPPEPKVGTTKKVSRCCQMSPGGRGCISHPPQVESHQPQSSVFLKKGHTISPRAFRHPKRQCPESK